MKKSLIKNDSNLESWLVENQQSLEVPEDLNLIINRVGDAHFVLLGEASHGTHEYYKWRAEISKRLIQEKGFSLIGVEGDWPDCYRLNRYIKGYDKHNSDATYVLREFNRWPTWMWANWEMVAFAEWLRKYNLDNDPENMIGFYGLDVYSLGESLEAIWNYLHTRDHKTAATVKKAMKCFDKYGTEGIDYARAILDSAEGCREELLELLIEIRNKMERYNTDPELVFSTEQNALVALHAENYYRSMMEEGPESWNIRDRHMAETVSRIRSYYGINAKVIIWAHNTHIGDARATNMSVKGLTNIGELLVRKYGETDVVRIGFGAHSGTVIAARHWGGKLGILSVPESIPGSWEYILHNTGAFDKILILDDLKNKEWCNSPIMHRAIGVVYQPDYEQFGNYVLSQIPLRYEAFIYIDHSEALHPLHVIPDGRQIPESFPWGL